MAAAPTGIVLNRINGQAFTLSHGEALCLMKYASADGQLIEWLWNSRDGVTPFGIGFPPNGLTHADWHEDAFAPNFVPPVGMKVFVSWADAPESYKAETRERWAERIATVPDAATAAELKAGEPFGFRPEDPCVVVVDQTLHDAFLALARNRVLHPKEVGRRAPRWPAELDKFDG